MKTKIRKSTNRSRVGRPKKDAVNLRGNSRQRILTAARRRFADAGFDKTTIQDIVSDAKVNLSLVSYYFGGKDKLYYACLEESSQYSRQESEKILVKPKSREEFKIRLKFFLEKVAEFYLLHPDEVAIINREIFSPNPAIKNLFDEGFTNLYRNLLKYFQEAQAAGIIRDQIDLSLFVLFLHTAFHRICQGLSPGISDSFKPISDYSFRARIIDFAVDSLSESIIAA